MASSMTRALPTASPSGSKATIAARPDRDGRRRHDGDVPRAHARRLLGGEHDVAVVGQHDDLVGAQRVDRLEELRRARVHGLPAVHDGLAAELAEQRLVALAGDDGDDHGALGDPAACLQTLVAGLRLLVHVVDLDLADRAELERFAEDDAGVVGVHVHLDHAAVADDQGAVAEREQERLEGRLVDALSRDQEARAVAVLRERRSPRPSDGVAGVARASPVRRATCAERDRDAGVHELGDAGGEPAEEHEKTVAAGVDDAGLLQGRQLLGRLLDRDAAGLLDSDEQLVQAERARARRAQPRPSRGSR